MTSDFSIPDPFGILPTIGLFSTIERQDLLQVLEFVLTPAEVSFNQLRPNERITQVKRNIINIVEPELLQLTSQLNSEIALTEPSATRSFLEQELKNVQGVLHRVERIKKDLI